LDLNSIEELVNSTPKNIETHSQAFNEFQLVQGVLRKAKSWRKDCNDLMTGIDNIYNQQNFKDSKRELNNLKRVAKNLQLAYNREDLR